LPNRLSDLFFAGGLDSFLVRIPICPSGCFVAAASSNLPLRFKRSSAQIVVGRVSAA
jgi:hypothetical protein